MGAPLNPVPGVLRVVLKGNVDLSSGGEEWVNILHFTYGGTPPSANTCSGLATNVGGGWNANVASLLPNQSSLQTVTVTDLTSPTSGSGEASTVHQGTRGDDPIPANAAVLISYPSTVRYKGGHPRTYLLALGVADLQSSSTWHAAAVAEVGNHWAAFLQGVINNGAYGGTVFSGFVTVRYSSKFAPNGGPPHYYLANPIVNPVLPTSIVVQSQLASQRGRIGRRSK